MIKEIYILNIGLEEIIKEILQELIIDDKNEVHVLTININDYYLERIDLKNGGFAYKDIGAIFKIEIDNSHKPSSKKSIIKLKDGNYLLSCIIYIVDWKNHHNLYVKFLILILLKIIWMGLI